MTSAEKIKELAAKLEQAAEGQDDTLGLAHFLGCRDRLHAAIDELQAAHDAACRVGDALHRENESLWTIVKDAGVGGLPREEARALLAQYKEHAEMYQKLREMYVYNCEFNTPEDVDAAIRAAMKEGR